MVIGISGMISSGKTSLVERIREDYPEADFLREYEDDDVVFNQFLTWLYEKRQNLTMAFQSFVLEQHSDKYLGLLKRFQKEGKNHAKDLIFLDRFSVEHYIFAYVNLLPKGQKYIDAFEALFMKMIFQEEVPDFAFYLDISWQTFKKRLFARGRNVEVHNFEENKAYFKTLWKIYKSKFEEMCQRFAIPYLIIDTNALELVDIFKIVHAKIKELLINPQPYIAKRF